jgi:hypothetical protein
MKSSADARLLPAVVAALLLCACSTPGTILQLPPAQPANAAYLTVPERDNVWVIPLKSKNSREMPITPEGLWVTQGWFTLEFQCYFPKNHPGHAEVPAGNPGKTMYFEDGHRYGLKCDDDKAGVIDLVDMGSVGKGD